MHCYCAISSKNIHYNSLLGCISWGNKRIKNNQAKIIKVIKLRPAPERYAQIILDIDKTGCWPAQNGRLIETSKLKRLINDE